mmetsp:Transcript_11130/g.19646  ORF Transcript_11130/g.19646 Transcript_11130/m.19646 type:complete len:256 (+) Transcript_11130:4554-5321(+)
MCPRNPFVASRSSSRPLTPFRHIAPENFENPEISASIHAPLKVMQCTSPPPPIEGVDETVLSCVTKTWAELSSCFSDSSIMVPAVLVEPASAVRTVDVPGVRFKCGTVDPRESDTCGLHRYDSNVSGTNEYIWSEALVLSAFRLLAMRNVYTETLLRRYMLDKSCNNAFRSSGDSLDVRNRVPVQPCAFNIRCSSGSFDSLTISWQRSSNSFFSTGSCPSSSTLAVRKLMIISSVTPVSYISLFVLMNDETFFRE